VNKPRKAPSALRASQTRASTPDREDGSAIGSLSRGLVVLNVLTQAQGWLPLSEIAADSGLDASTAHRLLLSLVEAGYAVRDEEMKRYLPGPRALSPLSLFHPLTQLRREALPVLEFLKSQIGETCAFVLFLGQERLVVDFVRGGHPLSPYYDTWLKSPLHGSASGRLLLAWLDESERETLLGSGPYQAYTPQTITSPKSFSEDLKRVRDVGYAVAREDTYQSLVAIGVPVVFNKELQPIGCLVVTAQSSSIPVEQEQKVAEQLNAAATLLKNGAPSMNVFRQWTVRNASKRMRSGES